MKALAPIFSFFKFSDKFDQFSKKMLDLYVKSSSDHNINIGFQMFWKVLCINKRLE